MSPFRAFAFALLLAGSCPAASPAPITGSTVDDQDAISIRGIFDFQLPKILRPEAWRLTFNPQLGDLVHEDYVRFRVGVRHSPARHLELSAEVVPFIDNFGDGGRGGAGLAEYRFGAKLAWHGWLRRYVDTAAGATVAMPAPGAPEEITIGTTRFNPYIAFSRDWNRTRGLGAFLNLGYEVFDSDPAPGRIAEYRPQRDNLRITPGLLLHRSPWHYSLAVSLRTTALDGGSEEYFSILPTASYEVPKEWLRGLPGRLVVGGGYEAVFHPGGTEHRVTSRVRWDYDWGRAARDLGNSVIDRLPWGDRGTGGGTR